MTISDMQEWFADRKERRELALLAKGTHIKCPACKHTFTQEEVARNGWICPKCKHGLPMPTMERIASLLDAGSFTETNAGLTSVDPLGFVDKMPYPARLAKAQTETGLTEAVVTGNGEICGHRVIIAVMDRRFITASMGSVVGEKIARAFEQGVAEKTPVITVVASGGARMQEGYLSLMQMPSTSAAARRLNNAGIPFLAVLTDPSYGGVLASFPRQADVIIGENGARSGFAGPELIEKITREKLPKGFQTAKFMLEHGLIDQVVDRSDLRQQVITFLDYMSGAPTHIHTQQLPPVRQYNKPLAFERELFKLEGELSKLKAMEVQDGEELQTSIAALEADIALAHQKTYTDLQPIDRVEISRHRVRPRTYDYVQAIFYDIFEIHGDGQQADDPSIFTALACIKGRRVMLIGQQKGWDLDSDKKFNWGMPSPEGYRKALKAMKIAGKFNLPIVTMIDTPGAYPGITAEEHGIAWAISDCIAYLSEIPAPVICVNIGEGGSGGAVAIGHGDRLIMLENAYYSVISPEMGATILFKNPSKAAAVAKSMKLTAQDMFDRGYANLVVPEPFGGAQKDPLSMYPKVEEAIGNSLDELSVLTPDELVEQRYARLRVIGQYSEGAVRE